MIFIMRNADIPHCAGYCTKLLLNTITKNNKP
jgi:hypothetical protein